MRYISIGGLHFNSGVCISIGISFMSLAFVLFCILPGYLFLKATHCDGDVIV